MYYIEQYQLKINYKNKLDNKLVFKENNGWFEVKEIISESIRIRTLVIFSDLDNRKSFAVMMAPLILMKPGYRKFSTSEKSENVFNHFRGSRRLVSITERFTVKIVWVEALYLVVSKIFTNYQTIFKHLLDISADVEVL